MPKDGLSEVILSSKPAYDGRILHVEEVEVTLPNGKPAKREVARHPGASAILPIWPDGRVSLVRQYRTALDRVILEVPAGKLDHKGEDRLEAAKRELHEETGLTAERWLHLTDIATTPGFCDEVISLYAAMGLKRGDTSFDEDEFLRSVEMPLAELVNMIVSSEVCDVKTICAAMIAAEKLRTGEIQL